MKRDEFIQTAHQSRMHIIPPRRPAVMRALMEYAGEKEFGCRSQCMLQPGGKIDCSYAFFVGVSGVASFFNWKPGWEEDNMEIMYMSDDPWGPFDRALQAAGYEYRGLGTEEGGRDQEALFRQEIMASIHGANPSWPSARWARPSRRSSPAMTRTGRS